MHDAADRQSEKFVHLADPLGIADGEIIIDRDQMDIAGKGVQVKWHRGDKRLAFARGHFRDFPLMQHDTAEELHIKRHHVPLVRLAAHGPFLPAETAAGVFHRGERFRQDIIQRRAVGETFPKLLGFRAKLLIAEFLVLRLDLVHAMNQRPETLYGALVLRAHDFFQYPTNHTNPSLQSPSASWFRHRHARLAERTRGRVKCINRQS